MIVVRGYEPTDACCDHFMNCCEAGLDVNCTAVTKKHVFIGLTVPEAYETAGRSSQSPGQDVQGETSCQEGPLGSGTGALCI